MRLSTRQPSIEVGVPHIMLEMPGAPTGDPEIDKGLKEFLLRVRGVSAVEEHNDGSMIMRYKVCFEVESMVPDLLTAIGTYYTSWGMTANLQVSARL